MILGLLTKRYTMANLLKLPVGERELIYLEEDGGSQNTNASFQGSYLDHIFQNKHSCVPITAPLLQPQSMPTRLNSSELEK